MITTLPTDEWTSRAKVHMNLVAPIADAFVERRKSGEKNPVHDFLFTYYLCSPQKLKQWVPSFEEDLIISEDIHSQYNWMNEYWFAVEENILSLNRNKINESVRSLAAFIADLCDKILQRAPRFGCFGLHEWAMVYKAAPESIRHSSYRLRLSSNELTSFVESQTLCCSHYDAYRFFTPEARPLNTLNPQLETRLQMEQAGCVHANMDLYKWAVKLWPWIGSDLIAKTFFLALEARELDMRASPYDLQEHGYLPICIETEEGRRLYQVEQQKLTDRATPLRKELYLFCQSLMHYRSE